MSKILAFLSLLLLPLLLRAQSETIALPAESVPLTDVIDLLEKEYGLLFSYKNDLVADVVVTPPSAAVDSDTFLRKILENTKIDFEIIDKNYVILSPRNPADDLLTFCGKIVDRLTDTPLEFANVYLQNTRTGTQTDAAGNFIFTAERTEEKTLTVSYLGYQARDFPAVAFAEGGCRTVRLDLVDYGEDLVIVKEYLTDGISLTENNNGTRLQPEKIGALPGSPEADVLHAAEFLPGVTSPDGSAAGLTMRGGTSDQNLILWEGIPVYHTAHYFGMISAFNPYIIDRADIYRGGFAAEYGGRVSGVIDLKSESVYPLSEPTYGAGINGLTGYVYGKAPILKKRAEILFSAGRSYKELWRSPAYESITRRNQQGVLLQIPIRTEIPESIGINEDFDLYHTNLKLKFHLSERDKMTAAGFFGENNFDSQITDTQIGRVQSDTLFLLNSGVRLAYERQHNQRLSLRAEAVLSDYRYDYLYAVNPITPPGLTQNGQRNNSIGERQLQAVGTYRTRRAAKWKAGLQTIGYKTTFGRTSEQTNNTVNRDEQTALQIAYASYGTDPTGRRGGEVGMRLTRFQNTGQFYPAPRLRLWQRVGDYLVLSLNAGKYYQFISQILEINSNDPSIDLPAWTLTGTQEVPVLSSVQTQIGAVFSKKGWLLDVQGYYKTTEGLTSLTTGFNENLVPVYRLGSSRTKGIDVLLKKRWGNWRTWWSYSLSKSSYYFPDFFDPEFPAPNDRRHILQTVVAYKKGRVNATLGWRIASGLPFSRRENFRIQIPQNALPNVYHLFPERGNFNGANLPYEHQLNASVTCRLTAETKTWQAFAGFSLSNIYNQNNVYSRTLFIENRRDEEPRIIYTNKTDTGFLPDFSLRVKW